MSLDYLLYTHAYIITPEALLAIDEQRVGLDLEIVLKTGLVLQQHLDTNVKKGDLSLFSEKNYLMADLVSHLSLIQLPVEQVDALLELTHLRSWAYEHTDKKQHKDTHLQKYTNT